MVSCVNPNISTINWVSDGAVLVAAVELGDGSGCIPCLCVASGARLCVTTECGACVYVYAEAGL